MAEFHNLPVVCMQMIDREQQLSKLRHLISLAKAGCGQVVLLAGEAGIGKSRLVQAVRSHAAGQQFELTQGHCFEPDHALPYAPLIDLLRSHLGAHANPDISAVLGPSTPLLLSLLPELVPPELNIPLPVTLEPAQAQRRIALAFAQFFTHCAAQGPLLVTIEDLHWSDDTSLDVLLILARHCTKLPILLLLTYRSEDLHAGLVALLAALERERLSNEIRIAPLDQAGVERMLQTIFDQRRPIRRDFLTALYALTEGNPFFVEEVIKSLITVGDIFYAHGEWDRKPLTDLNIPRTIQVAVRQRAQQLPLPAQRLLSLAAVAGRRFDFGLLQCVTGHDEPSMLELIKALIAAHLVVEESAETFAFRHALTREALYNDLLARERKTLHASIANALEGLTQGASSAASDIQIADLSYHFFAAERWNKALVYAQQAADRARDVHALRPAVTHLSRALIATQQLAIPTPLILYRSRGKVYELLGEFELACDDYQAVLAGAQAGRDRVAEWQAMLDLGFLWAARDYVQMGFYRQQALDVARTLHNPAILGQSLNRVGNWYLFAEQPREALRYHHEALALFQGTSDLPGLAATYDLLGITHMMGDDIPAAVAHYQHAVALFRELGDLQGLSSSLSALALRGGNYSAITSYWPEVDQTACAQDGMQALRIARQIGWRAGEAGALVYLALSHGPHGAHQLALEYAQAALVIAEEIKHSVWLFGAHFALGVLALDLLNYGTARWQLEQALAYARELGFFFVRRVAGFLALLHLARSDIMQAEAILAESFTPEMPMEAQGQRLVWFACAKSALLTGNLTLALEIVDRLIVSATQISQERAEHVPHLLQLRGEALTALAHFDEAEEALIAADSAASRRGLAPTSWRIQANLGRLYQRQGRRREAETAFAHARGIAEALSASLVDTARMPFLRELATLLPHSAPPTLRRATRDAFDGLTERERDVAALIAVGQSNRTIADALVISERTVETHISSMRSKLGFTSRQQIVAWAIRKGLADNSE